MAIESFKDVIDAFGGTPAFARRFHLTPQSATNMYARDSIAFWHFDAIERGASALNLPIDLRLLMRLKGEQRSEEQGAA